MPPFKCPLHDLECYAVTSAKGQGYWKCPADKDFDDKPYTLTNMHPWIGWVSTAPEKSSGFMKASDVLAMQQKIDELSESVAQVLQQLPAVGEKRNRAE